MFILELNDYRIRLISPEQTIVYSDVAAAAVVDKQFVFGGAALQAARLHPQQFNQRYLGTLSAQSLPTPMLAAQNLADLLYHHFASLPIESANLALLTPAHYSNEQLGLLLGILQELGHRVRGFIDIAACQAMEPHGTDTQQPTAVLDLELQRTTLTPLNSSGDQAEVGTPTVWEGQGFAHVFEGWMSAIADDFVERTRFDPLHAANTEQQLADQLWAWCALPEAHALRVQVVSGDAPHEAEFQPHRLAEKLAQRLANIDLSGFTSVLLSDLAGRLPGLQAHLQAQFPAVTLTPLSGNHVYHARDLAKDFSAEGITRIRRAPITSETAPSTAAPRPEAVSASHLLQGHTARPLAAFSDLPSGELAVGARVDLNTGTWTGILVEDA